MKTMWLRFSVIAFVVSCNRDVAKNENGKKIEVRRRGEAWGKVMIDNAKLCEKRSKLSALDECLRACDLGHSNSCAQIALAKNQSGHLDKAIKYSTLACDGGSGVGCELLGTIKSDEPALSMARIHHRVHCEQGYAKSCKDLANMFKNGIGGKADLSTALHFESLANRSD